MALFLRGSRNMSKPAESVKNFISSLSEFESPRVFNPWRNFHSDYEVENAVSIRQEQLTTYLTRRIRPAKILLIAEACGYQGGHFTGIAMTCERMILNKHPVVDSTMILGKQGHRTSRSESPYITKEKQKKDGFNEPTDTVVWSACLEAGLRPDEFILWNIFPFHPYKDNQLLTNRTPTDEELRIGLHYTKKLMEITGPLPLFAIGKKSELTLSGAGLTATCLRHPANGGANIFRSGLKNALSYT